MSRQEAMHLLAPVAGGMVPAGTLLRGTISITIESRAPKVAGDNESGAVSDAYPPNWGGR